MAQQSKPDINTVWASAGDTGTPPLDFDVNQGWLAEKPPFQEMNWLQNRFNQFMKHMNEFGIAEWDTNTNYANNALVIYNDNHYTSDNNDNSGNTPTVSNWSTVDFQPALPPGSIIDWQGDYDNPPSGWAICDGNNGTPDLRNRFIEGADSSTGLGSLGNTGGSTAKNTSNDGAHIHTTDLDGAHNHAVTIEPHTLTFAEMPNHDHNIPIDIQENQSTSIFAEAGTNTLDGPGNWPVSSAGGSSPHIHGSTTSNHNGHTHTVVSNGTHAHTINDARPSYYVLVKIMKL